ncbi:hypothetical protein V6N11_051447 [Hibiscus sabdariffa]|uniref:Uncharacterized protein n=1 Tax=Hibiscus sabdariffa TaxID=183260 RepID=A0ABR2U742_9ROSI
MGSVAVPDAGRRSDRLGFEVCGSPGHDLRLDRRDSPFDRRSTVAGVGLVSNHPRRPYSTVEDDDGGSARGMGSAWERRQNSLIEYLTLPSLKLEDCSKISSMGGMTSRDGTCKSEMNGTPNPFQSGPHDPPENNIIMGRAGSNGMLTHFVGASK